MHLKALLYSQNNRIIACDRPLKTVRRFCNSKVDVSITLPLLPDNILWKGTIVLIRVKCCGFLIPFECPHQEFREHGEFKEKWGHVPRTFGQIIPSMIRTKALLSIVIIGSLAPSLPLLLYVTHCCCYSHHVSSNGMDIKFYKQKWWVQVEISLDKLWQAENGHLNFWAKLITNNQ